MIRLALVRQRYSAYGGAERYVGRALAGLSASGEVDVTLVARRWDDDAGWRTRRIDPFSLTRIGRDRVFAREAAECFAQYDLVQSDEPIAGAAIYRAIDGVHATRMEQASRTRASRAQLAPRLSHYDRHLLALEAETLRHPALKCVLCHSRFVAADVVRRYGIDEARTALVYNPVDAALYNPGLVRHRVGWRQQHAIGNDVPLLAMVGSDFARRGVPTALAAIEPFPDVHLAIAGTDKQSNHYVRQAERMGLGARVHFLGAMPNARPLYGAADAFILPSLYDPFSNACAEALAAGLPAFTSATCGTSDWIRQGETGWVSDALDVEAHRAAVAQWLQRSAHWPSMREAAHKSSRPYTLERMIRELAALYERLLQA